MTVTKGNAVDLVRQLLGSQFGEDLKTENGDQVLIQHDDVEEYSNAWSVPFNTKTYLDGGPPSACLASTVGVVPKDSSIGPHFLPASMSVADYLGQVREGVMNWAQLPEGLVTYFARVSEQRPRSSPRGIARRRVVNGRVIDEAFTRNLKWEPTSYFVRYRFGDNYVDHVKITAAEADAFIKKAIGENGSQEAT